MLCSSWNSSLHTWQQSVLTFPPSPQRWLGFPSRGGGTSKPVHAHLRFELVREIIRRSRMSMAAPYP